MTRSRRGSLALAVTLAAGCHQAAAPPAPGDEGPDEPFRAQRPMPGPAHPFRLPDAQRFSLASGAEVLLIERHTVPYVYWEMQFPGGGASDPPGKEGRADLCTGLMVQAQGDTASRLADMASTVSIASGRDTTTLRGFALRSRFEATLDLWARVLTLPGNSSTDLDRVRQRRLASLSAARSDPGSIASRLFWIESHGDTHPYARMPTAASYAAVTADDCRRYRDDFIHDGGSRLLVAGDVTRTEVERLFSARLTDGRAVAAPAALPPRAPRAGRLAFLHVPGASQSLVVVWGPGPSRQSPDYYAATVLASIIADGPGSRLFANLREMMGTVYSVFGSFVYTKSDGLLFVEVPVQTERTSAAVTEVLRELARVRDVDVSDAELGLARDGRIAALPARFATAVDALDAFGELAYYGLPASFFDDFGKNFGAVDAAAVRQSAQAFLADDQLHFVVVGDGKIVLPMLRPLVAPGGPLAGSDLRIVDADGRPAPAP
jgi:zinc protease